MSQSVTTNDEKILENLFGELGEISVWIAALYFNLNFEIILTKDTN